MSEQILTAEEVAHELRCSKTHIYRVIRGVVAGVSPIPVLRLGRRRLILRSTLEEWKRTNQGNVMLGTAPEAASAERTERR